MFTVLCCVNYFVLDLFNLSKSFRRGIENPFTTVPYGKLYVVNYIAYKHSEGGLARLDDRRTSYLLRNTRVTYLSIPGLIIGHN